MLSVSARVFFLRGCLFMSLCLQPSASFSLPSRIDLCLSCSSSLLLDYRAALACRFLSSPSPCPVRGSPFSFPPSLLFLRQSLPSFLHPTPHLSCRICPVLTEFSPSIPPACPRLSHTSHNWLSTNKASGQFYQIH